MNSTKHILSNPKVTVDLPTTSDLAIQVGADIESGLSLVWHPVTKMLSLGTAASGGDGSAAVTLAVDADSLILTTSAGASHTTLPSLHFKGKWIDTSYSLNDFVILNHTLWQLVGNPTSAGEPSGSNANWLAVVGTDVTRAYVDSQIQSVNNNVGTTNAVVQTLTARVLALENRGSRIEAKASATDAKVFSLDGNVAGLDTRMQSVEGQLPTITSNYQNLNARVTAVENLTQQLDTEIGSLANLTTEDKTSLVAAINEVLTKAIHSGADLTTLQNQLIAINTRIDSVIASTNQDNIDTNARIDTCVDVYIQVEAQIVNINKEIGYLSALTTTDKSSIVNAINEIKSSSGSLVLFELPEYVANQDGSQSFTLPANTSGVIDINILANNGNCRPVYQKHYNINNGLLLVTNMVAGEKLCGSYYLAAGDSTPVTPPTESIIILDIQGDDSISISSVQAS